MRYDNDAVLLSSRAQLGSPAPIVVPEAASGPHDKLLLLMLLLLRPLQTRCSSYYWHVMLLLLLLLQFMLLGLECVFAAHPREHGENASRSLSVCVSAFNAEGRVNPLRKLYEYCLAVDIFSCLG